MSNGKDTLITVRVPEKTKENLKEYLGNATFKELMQFIESLFAEGDIYEENGDLILNQPAEATLENQEEGLSDPIIEEFKTVCEAMSMDWKYGMRKAINAIKRRDI